MLANSIRMEGWIFSFIIGIYLLLIKRRVNQKIIIYAILTATPILLFMWNNYTKMGHPLHALIFSDFEVKQSTNMATSYIWNNIMNTLFAFSGISFIFGAMGFIIALVKKKGVFISCLFASTYFLLLYKVITNTLVSDFRYFTAQAIFMYLLSGYFISYIISLIKEPMTKEIVKGIVLIILGVSLTKDYIAYYRNYSNYPLRFHENYWSLTNKIKENDQLNIYLDSGEHSIQHAVQYHTRINAQCITQDRPWLGEIFKEDDFRKCVENNDINAIILLPQGGLVRHLGKDKLFIEKYFDISQKYIYGEYRFYLVERKGVGEGSQN